MEWVIGEGCCSLLYLIVYLFTVRSSHAMLDTIIFRLTISEIRWYALVDLRAELNCYHRMVKYTNVGRIALLGRWISFVFIGTWSKVRMTIILTSSAYSQSQGLCFLATYLFDMVLCGHLSLTEIVEYPAYIIGSLYSVSWVWSDLNCFSYSCLLRCNWLVCRLAATVKGWRVYTAKKTVK